MQSLKVLDISQGVAGPLCANLLWQQGAEVFKVEPRTGDWARHVGTSYEEDHSALSISYNAGKKSVCIDVKSPEGKAIILKMVAQCDIFIQNFRPGVVERLGLSYEELKAINPHLIYVSISGYGPEGPYALSPATDSVMQAETGIMHANRQENNQPKKMNLLMVDILSGMNACMQVLSVLAKSVLKGQKTARGHHIEMNLFDACASFQLSNIIDSVLNTQAEQTVISAPNDFFKAKDGFINILALNNQQFERIAKAIEKEEWLSDERFKNNSTRIEHRTILHQAIQAFIEDKTIEECLAIFQSHDVLHAPVRNYEQVINHPQAHANHTFHQLKQNDNLSLPYALMPGLEQPPSLEPSPAIGEHTIEIMKHFSFTEEAIHHYLEHSIIYQQ